MQTPSDVLSCRLLAGITDAMVEESAAYREDPAPPLPPPVLESGGLENAQAPADWRDAISNAGYTLIVRWETGGRSYYEGVIKGRPIWPGYASGITIGCGFDLGYHERGPFLEEWGGRLGAADLERLGGVVGFKTVAPDRALKVGRAKELVRRLADIVVPWPVAIEQFEGAKLPRLLGQLYRALPEVAALHPHCRAALLSLLFNRGAAFRAEGERFAEMRAIGAAVRSGEPRELARVPGLLRAMKRIWGSESSLARRREDEAVLFESGLQERGTLESLNREQQEGGLEGSVLEGAPGSAEQHEDLPVEPSDETDERDEQEDQPPAPPYQPDDGLESGSLSAANVHWNPRDDEHPDYRHLDRTAAFSSFELTPADLDLLIEANAFFTQSGRLLFALRGAALPGGAQVDAASIVVTDQRPDHRNFRCVMGAYDRDRRRLSAFPASTVPNAHYVFRCFTLASQGTAPANLTGNMLPTGCYTYAVGTHRAGQAGEIPTVLRLSNSATGASRVLVLRSIADLQYDRFDPFLVATPADNIHPGQLSEGFSSAGCLTLPGRFAGGSHSGVWRDFRAASGLDRAHHGELFSLMLLTGLDAAAATRVRTAGTDPASLRRLRHGSKGERVAALQAALGLAPDNSRLVGPITRAALVRRQASVLGWADGIHSPAMDGLLGLRVFTD
ncbi:hypothetical protein [Massilia sp. Leaf139]|uniref:hypothetical protein n=1 Tax=Massilia sp. Leaf139 TaxID=1736272 RepID=UPI0006FC27F0|nr:hypothetical protein [Massilia sp. Leaf139]KQQ86781.1 hypothetical protein ASF77_18970 [Massilia sp. Leaf139]